MGRSEGPRERTRTRVEWKNRLERALEADDLLLYLQPIIDVPTRRVVGAVALVRLDDDGVVVPPSEFVRVAERAGMATRLDHWVVRAAVAMAARLRRIEPDFSMWINVSAQSVSSEELGTALLANLADHGVPPSAVVLELTETSPVNDVSAARSLAQRLRAAGVRLALDDFGTGFASLLYLRHLLFDFVKIDGEFVAELDTSDTDCTIVRSIVDLATELGMQTVAEHVGSPGVLDVVSREGIALAQGFGIGRPCTEDKFVTRHLTASSKER